MFKTFGSTKEVFVNQDEGMFVALPITLDTNSLTLETEVRQGRTYALAGSLVKDGTVAKGILPEEYDITDGITPARVAVAGYAWASRLTANALAAISALPNIVVMPFKAIVIALVKTEGLVATLKVEGAKWASTVAANQFTFAGSALTIDTVAIDDDGNLAITFTAAGTDSITAINSAALVDTTGKAVHGLPLAITVSA